MSVTVIKEFTFDSAHQLVGHCGKCANVHGHTYKLHVALKGQPILESGASDEGFVIDFTDLKRIVKEKLVDPLDHAFIAQGNEAILDVNKESGSKTVVLGFRTTVENMAQYMVWKLHQEGLPVDYIQLWETPTGSAIVRLQDLIEQDGPIYNTSGQCDLD